MGKIHFRNNKVLFANNKVAMHENCCCGGCDLCLGGIGPAQIQVVISGLANQGCGDCASLDGTYVLTHDIWGLECQWVYYHSFPCSLTYLQLVVQDLGGGNYRIVVQFSAAGGGVDPVGWCRYYTSKPDCANLSGESLSPVTTSADCDESSAVCTITAL